MPERTNGKTIKVNVDSKQSTINVSGISLNKTSLSLVSTKTEKLIATVVPNNASNKKVKNVSIQ